MIGHVWRAFSLEAGPGFWILQRVLQGSVEDWALNATGTQSVHTR